MWDAFGMVKGEEIVVTIRGASTVFNMAQMQWRDGPVHPYICSAGKVFHSDSIGEDILSGGGCRHKLGQSGHNPLRRPVNLHPARDAAQTSKDKGCHRAHIGEKDHCRNPVLRIVLHVVVFF